MYNKSMNQYIYTEFRMKTFKATKYSEKVRLLLFVCLRQWSIHCCKNIVFSSGK
jgi:hypothetical protein